MNKKKRKGIFFIGLIVSVCITTAGYFKGEIPPLGKYLRMDDAKEIIDEFMNSNHNKYGGKASIDPANPGKLPQGIRVSQCQKLIADRGLLTGAEVLHNFPKNVEFDFAVVNDNKPGFSGEELDIGEYESYSEFDVLGRCRPAIAMLGKNMMPTEKRGSIGMIKPSGWHTVRYDDLIADKYLYNRCHLIGYQLSGENANEKNLITGTRYFNVEGMLPFEDMVAEYIKATDNHVLYRVSPVFNGNELVARGVQIEAESVEDKAICYNVFVYNVQPDIDIDYLTGKSKAK